MTNSLEMPHHIILDSRQRLSVSGVQDVESFDETGVVMLTSKGALVVRGSGLHIDKLSIEGGEVNIEGLIDSLAYESDGGQKSGFWQRLLG